MANIVPTRPARNTKKVDGGWHFDATGEYKLPGLRRTMAARCRAGPFIAPDRPCRKACLCAAFRIRPRQSSRHPFMKGALMARVTVEDCIDKVDNRFELVL